MVMRRRTQEECVLRPALGMPTEERAVAICEPFLLQNLNMQHLWRCQCLCFASCFANLILYGPIGSAHSCCRTGVTEALHNAGRWQAAPQGARKVKPKMRSHLPPPRCRSMKSSATQPQPPLHNCLPHFWSGSGPCGHKSLLHGAVDTKSLLFTELWTRKAFSSRPTAPAAGFCSGISWRAGGRGFFGAITIAFAAPLRKPNGFIVCGEALACHAYRRWGRCPAAAAASAVCALGESCWLPTVDE